MVPLGLTLWAIGAWLIVVCVALIWSERVRIVRQAPVCAACDYSLAGLDSGARCPECNGDRRRVLLISRTPRGAPAIALLWWIPAICAFLAWVLAAVALDVGGIHGGLLLVAMLLTFAQLSLTIRPLTRWLPPAAVVRMVVFGAAAMLLGVAWLVAVSITESLPRDLGSLALLPVLIWPYCGLGLAAALRSMV